MKFEVDELASSSSFPSSSTPTSSTARSWTYHVFLSFRGHDTRKGFRDHLGASLERKGITCFKDDKDLERGHAISVEILKAIQESLLAVIILSPNYASSTWCLDELKYIVECNERLGLEVVPVFYGVDPSDVRHQRGSFERAFKKHEEKFGQQSDKVLKWRDALRHVASYSGWDSKDWHEAALVESIAKEIHAKLIPKFPSCTDSFVGIASRVEEVTGLMGIGLNDVRFIGIWGMGGIGKTSIARAVYEAIQGKFEGSCFLSNIREVCETSGLVHIQRELVSRLNISGGDFYDLYDSRKTIQNSLCNKKILLVLDDVSELSQLENLVGKQDWFGPGSRVIITTRDMHLLRVHGVHETYEVGDLFHDEALRLFCSKAFKSDQPHKGYQVLSEEVVTYTRGLPLALEVLGSYLYGRAINVWHSALKQIRCFPHPKIADALRISYEGLSPLEKNLFLDIACFFNGMDLNKVIDILENCGRSPRIGIEVLIERSLVTLDWHSNNLKMHDLLQAMGRNIVFQESPNDPSRRSRLWSHEDIDYVFSKNKGTEAVQGIVLNLLHPHEAYWSIEALSKASQLKFLILNDVQLNSSLNSLPSSIKVLHWRGCSLISLPLTDQSYKFVDIKLSHSKIGQLWHGKKILDKLKYLDLSFSDNLICTPDFSGVPNLERLVLEGCSSLTDVHPSLVHHKKLALMNLKDCKSLKALPGKLEMNSLLELILSGCAKFKHFPELEECMKHLSELSLQGTAIRKLPSSIGCLVGLVVLNLMNCKRLVSLPNTIYGLNSLKELNLCDCSKFKTLPEFSESMKHLSALSLNGTAIRKLPSSLGYLVGLEDLNLQGCKNLACLPFTIHRLKSLRNLNTSGCSKLCTLIEGLNEELYATGTSTESRKLSFSRSHGLFHWPFQIQHTSTKLGLPPPVLSLPSLTTMDLSYCHLCDESIFLDFLHLRSLFFLDLSGNNFVSVPINVLELSNLKHLVLNCCRKLRLLPELPPSIRKLDASDCDSLETSKLSPHSLFASLGGKPPKVLDPFDMLITGCQIPSWFIHQEDGMYVSVPNTCPPNQRVGIALCFLLISYGQQSEHQCLYIVECRKGMRGIRERSLPYMKPNCFHLYIIFLTNDHCSDGVIEDSRFGLFQIGKTYNNPSTSECSNPRLWELKIERCGARFVCMQDLEDLTKSIEQMQ